MINGIKKETIVSTTEDRLTLLRWLKKLEKTLSDDTLADIVFNDDNGNVSLALTFEDGTTKSVAFPYNMSKFATKEDLSKPLEFKNKLDLNDRMQFDLVSSEDTLDYNLKIKLENGIYPLDTSSIKGTEEQRNILITFGLTDGDRLDYEYLQLMKGVEGASQPFDPTNGYCNGLNENQCYVKLGRDYRGCDYFIIINNGIVTFAFSQEF